MSSNNHIDGRPSWLMEEGKSSAAVTTTMSSSSSSNPSATLDNGQSYSWMDQSNDDGNKNNNQQTTTKGIVVDSTSTAGTTSAPLGDGTTTATTTTPGSAGRSSSKLNKSQSAAVLASEKTWGQYFRETFQRDGRLLLVCIGILIIMNIPYLKLILYPFTIFSTWIHELCHGLAALFVGGSISKLLIYPDTSGLAYTAVPRGRGFVISAGYQGTAVIGCLLLLIRRTKRGPRSGTMGLAITMLISVVLWIRNIFGICFIGAMSIILGGLAYKLPSTHIRNLYMILAVTTCLNAITSVQALFGASHVVNGQSSSTDAHSMADLKGGSSIGWALLWFLLSIILTILGFIFAIPGPDEVADFVICGTCQDIGCFKLCNCRGKRLCSKLISSFTGSNSGGGTSTTTNQQ